MSGRLRPAVATVCAALALTGCSAAGDVFVRADGITIDLVLEHSSDPSAFNPCTQTGGRPFVTTPREAPPGRSACTVSASITFEDTAEYSFSRFVVRSADAYFLQVEPFLGGGPVDRLESFDVTVHFPGPVIASNGSEVRGDTVRWTDASQVAEQGLAATARTSWMGPEVGYALLGLAAGAAGGAVLVWGALRRRKPSPAPDEGDTDRPGHDALPSDAALAAHPWEPADEPAASPTPVEPEDPSVWSPEAR